MWIRNLFTIMFQIRDLKSQELLLNRRRPWSWILINTNPKSPDHCNERHGHTRPEGSTLCSAKWFLGLWSVFALYDKIDAVSIQERSEVSRRWFVVVVVVVVAAAAVTQSFGFVYCVIAGADEDLLRLMCPTKQAPIVLFAWEKRQWGSEM